MGEWRRTGAFAVRLFGWVWVWVLGWGLGWYRCAGFSEFLEVFFCRDFFDDFFGW